MPNVVYTDKCYEWDYQVYERDGIETGGKAEEINYFGTPL